MTAIDAAVQSKLLGAEEVTIVYRRGQAEMKASRLGAGAGADARRARSCTGRSRCACSPTRSATCMRSRSSGRASTSGRLVGTGEIVTLSADMVFKAIGQTFVPAPLDGAAASIRLEGGRIAVDDERRTSMPGVWAGGDCVAGGEDLTVAAAQDGKLAAEIIHRALAG